MQKRDRRDYLIMGGGWVLVGLLLILIVNALNAPPLPGPIAPPAAPVPLCRQEPVSWETLPYATRYRIARQIAIAGIWGHPQELMPRDEAAESLERYVLSGGPVLARLRR
jgi:hypothetical protein